MELLKKLSGGKTYICIVVWSIIQALRYFGVAIDPMLDKVVIAAGGAAMRAGVKKSGVL